MKNIRVRTGWTGVQTCALSGSDAEAKAAELLAPLRHEIDEIDASLVDLLRQRFELVHKVAAVKEKHDIPTVDPKRMDLIRVKIAERAEAHGIDVDFMAGLYELLFAESIAIENRILGRK